MLTMVHANPVFVENGELVVDRKFHLGMRKYCESISGSICTVNPEDEGARRAMDAVRVPLDDLGYSVLPVKIGKGGRATGATAELLRRQIKKSRLLYGMDFGSGATAAASGIPYIAVLEYDLGTRLKVIATETPGILRRAVRSTRAVAGYYTTMRLLRTAREVHCNGYPIYRATRHWAKRRLLYLDSRITMQDIIPRDQLEIRLRARPGRPLRLLYSGRYESMKGALDVVQVAVECLKQGTDIELDCYGQGSLTQQMKTLARKAAPDGRIRIHDAIPFPDLVRRSREADLFVCCHVQSDPSCTYLESMGSGLPIAGYANRMWSGLQAESGAGVAVPVGDSRALASEIRKLVENPQSLDALSWAARDFSLDHTFDKEFAKRTDAINAALAEINAPRATQMRVEPVTT